MDTPTAPAPVRTKPALSAFAFLGKSLKTGSGSSAGPSAAADYDLPATPGGSGGAAAPESFRSGEEQFATPRSSKIGSDASFKSAQGGSGHLGTSDLASFKSAQGGGGSGGGAAAGSVVSFASARSNASRMTSATSASRHESAVEFPQAFVPTIIPDSPNSDSEHGSAERLPVLAAQQGAGAARPSAGGSRLSGARRMSGSGGGGAGSVAGSRLSVRSSTAKSVKSLFSSKQ